MSRSSSASMYTWTGVLDFLPFRRTINPARRVPKWCIFFHTDQKSIADYFLGRDYTSTQVSTWPQGPESKASNCHSRNKRLPGSMARGRPQARRRGRRGWSACSSQGAVVLGAAYPGGPHSIKDLRGQPGPRPLVV